jgi:hypothetical protein
MNPTRPTHPVEPRSPDVGLPLEARKSAPGGGAENWFRTLKEHWLLAVGLSLGFVVGLFAGSSLERPFPFKSVEVPSMDQCVSSTLKLLDLKQAPSIDILRQSVEHCYAMVRAQGLLSDFSTRELNFHQQYNANGVLMWMVVIVTCSGVGLAAVQLVASYRLAASNDKSAMATTNSEISLKRDQIVLKSSITGLFILLLSFGFFIVFVLYVYRFDKPEDHNAPTEQQIINVPRGGLGPPAEGAKAP